MRIKVTFENPETESSVMIKPFEMLVPAALWSFLSEDEQKEYCIRSFFSSHSVKWEID